MSTAISFRLIFGYFVLNVLKMLVVPLYRFSKTVTARSMIYWMMGMMLCINAQRAAAASFYYFRHYQVDEGLLHNNVTAITQDHRGFMWIGTRGGINRYDGYTFKSYLTPKTASGANYVKVMRTDKTGYLWVGTGAGLLKINTVTEELTSVSFLSNLNIIDILVDTKNNLWILTGQGLHRYDQKTGALNSYNVPVAAMDIDGNDQLYMVTADGQFKKLDINTNKISNLTLKPCKSLNRPGITQLKIIGNHLYIGSTYGLTKINAGDGTCTPVLLKDAKGTEIFVRDIFPSVKKDLCYVASESGVYIYNFKSERTDQIKKTPADPYSLNDNAVYAVFEDKRESLWVGTFFGGLNYLSKENNQFEKYYPLNIPGAISGNAVREITEDNYGQMWIGTEDAGLNRFNKSSGQFIQTPYNNPVKGISHPNIHGLATYNNQLFLGLFFHGLEVMNIHTGNIIDRHPRVPANGRNSTIVMCIYKTSDNRVLVGTTGAGLFEYHEKSKTLTPVMYIPGGSFVYAIEEDHTGTIWTGSLVRGIFYFNPKTGKSGNIALNLPGDTIQNPYTVQGIFEDSDYNLWLATAGGGLFKINRERKIVKRFTTEDGLPSNTLYRILEDSKKNLWISSLKGLICFNTETGKSRTYTKANGLITDQFNYNSAFKDASGKMYFGTVKGMVAFTPEQLTINREAPPLYINGVFVNYETPASAHTSDSLVLKDDQTTFSIEFAALDFSAADAVQYKYKMEGLDKQWIHLASNRRAYFTDVPAGTYRFTVQAESNLGYWQSELRTMTITILPPFWKSAPALIIYTLAGLCAIILSFYLYHKNLARKNERKNQLFELEKERETYHTKINFFTNIAHEIQTPLALIKGPLEWAITQIHDINTVKRNLELVNRNTDRLVRLTTELLDFRKIDSNQFKLTPVETDITAFLQQMVTAFAPATADNKKSIKLQLPSSPVIAFIDPEAVQKIISNLLSNAIKYAHSRIVVKLYINEANPDCFSIRVINDGQPIPAESEKKIFEPFYRVPSQSHLRGTGIGLSLAQSLCQLHGGTLEYIKDPSRLNIFELTLPIHPG